MPTPAQKIAVALAFVAAATSFGAGAIRLFHDGAVDLTAWLGGMLMLALAIGGSLKIRNLQRKSRI